MSRWPRIKDVYITAELLEGFVLRTTVIMLHVEGERPWLTGKREKSEPS